MRTECTTITRELLNRACEEAEIDFGDIRDDYSGASMYGETCLGIAIGDTDQAALFLVELTGCLALDDNDREIDARKNDVYDAIELARGMARRMRIDSMGHWAIAYFPGITVEG